MAIPLDILLKAYPQLDQEIRLVLNVDTVPNWTTVAVRIVTDPYLHNFYQPTVADMSAEEFLNFIPIGILAGSFSRCCREVGLQCSSNDLKSLANKIDSYCIIHSIPLFNSNRDVNNSRSDTPNKDIKDALASIGIKSQKIINGCWTDDS